MAKLRTEVYYDHHAGRVTRLGHHNMRATVHTWHTFVKVSLNKDGSGTVDVTQNGKTIHTINIKPESKQTK